MMEYFAYKRFKKNKKEDGKHENKGKDKDKASAKESNEAAVPAPSRQKSHRGNARDPSPSPSVTPVLDQDDESFLEALLADDSPPPALPPRIKTPEVSWEESDEESSKGKAKKTKEKAKDKRFSLAFLSGILDRDKESKDKDKDKQLALPQDLSRSATGEERREERDMDRVLNDLNLSARNNRAVSLSAESADLARRFNQVLRDLVRGVPTAVGDLQSLIEDRDGVIERSYGKLPSSLQKLVEKMPDKLTASLAPDLLAAAAESQGKSVDKGAGLGDAAKTFLSPSSIMELVTKPGAVVSMLRAIVNALKLRWPAFMGTNILWSVAVFLLLFVLWYCYKRGREERIKEEEAGGVVSGSSKSDKKKDKKDKKKDKKIADHDELEVEDVTDQYPDASSSAPARTQPVPTINEPGQGTNTISPPPMGDASSGGVTGGGTSPSPPK